VINGRITPVYSFLTSPSRVTVAALGLSGRIRLEGVLSTELSIAVIDDDDSFRLALVESLHSLGYGARGFFSAEEFMAGDGESLCNCIITDIHMPGMSGFDLKQQLAARGSKMPVIMITARAGPSFEAKAAASGAVCLLRKPFPTEALLDCLERAAKY